MTVRTIVTQDDQTLVEKSVKLISTDPVSPSTDELWYNTTSNQLKYYDGFNTITVGSNRNYSTISSPVEINSPVNLTGTSNIDWSLGKVFYKPDVNGDVTFTFSNVTDKDIVVIVEPTLSYYNSNLGININFPQPFYSDNYNGYNTIPLSLPSPALYGLFYISSKSGKIYIKGYTVNSNQLTLTRKPWGWGGDATYGQLGNNTTNNVSSPILLVGNHVFTNMTGGYQHSLGLKSDGSAWSWGQDNYGQLGNNSTNNISSPVLVVGNHSFINTTTGDTTSFGLKIDGSLWSWGYNNFGQLGINTDTNNRSSPVVVVGAHSFIGMAGTTYLSLGLKANGQAWTWGINQYGQLGNNADTNNRSSPILVQGGHSFISAINANFTSLGLKIDGTVWAWGYNGHGEFGSLGTANRSSPVAVQGGHSFINIAGGGYQTLGLKTNGQIWMWGRNSAGSLGIYADTNSRSSPVLVVGSHSFINIASGYYHSYGFKSDGSVWSWGDNSYGQLGDTTTNNKSSPVLVIGNIYFTKNISNQGYFSLGIQR